MVLSEGIKPTLDDYNEIVSAQIPDSNKHPDAFIIVTRLMIRDICGAINPRSPYTKDNIYTKKYPKKFNEHTYCDDNRNVIYKSANNNV